MWWPSTTLAAFLSLIVTAVLGQNDSPTIPDHLIECYRNNSIFHRSNRISSTLPALTSIIRKIENSAAGRNMNAREIATALQNFVRMDGIEPSPVASTDLSIVPFAPMGEEFFRYRLTILSLLGKPSLTHLKYITDALTTFELCNLHFMLSYSVDSSLRDDERCEQAQQEYSANRRGRWRREERESEEEDKQVEQLPPDLVDEMQKTHAEKEVESDQKTSQFTIGDQDLLGGRSKPSAMVVRKFPTRLPSYVATGERSKCPIENGIVRTKYGSVAMGTVIAGIAAGLSPQKINPTKLGVTQAEIRPDLVGVNIDNVWGTTLAGDLADLILSVGLITDGVQRALGLKGGWNNTINPQWFLLEKNEPKYVSDSQLRGSLDGLWLGSSVKEWVDRTSFLSLSQILDSYYGSTGYAGGIVKACNRRTEFGNYAKSEILRPQVEVFSTVLQKQRVSSATITDFTDIVQTVTSNLQTYVPSFDSGSVCNSGDYANAQMSPTDYFLNLVVVIDSAWQEVNIKNILMLLIGEEVVATPYQTNTTIICGQNGQIIYQGDNMTSFYSNFTTRNCPSGIDLNPSLYNIEVIFRGIYNVDKSTSKVTPGSLAVLFLPQSSSSIQNSSTYWDTRNRINSTMPDIKFIVASNGPKDSFRSLVDNINEDVFTIQVPVPNDVQNTVQIQSVANRLKTIPQRLTQPQCGSYMQYASGQGSLTDNVRLGYTKYMRLHPNYFYEPEDTPSISIRSLRGTALSVCYSRTNPTPGGTPPDTSTNGQNPKNGGGYNPQNPYDQPTPSPYGRNYMSRQTAAGDQKCVQVTASATRIPLDDNPCSGYSRIGECPPLYISVSAPLGSGMPTTQCQRNCRLPTNVEFEVSVNYLGCESGAEGILVNPIVLLITTVFLMAARYI